MSDIGKAERATQNRVIALFRDELDYRFMGDWSDRANRQIEEGLLRDWLANRGHTPEQIGRTLDLLGHDNSLPCRHLGLSERICVLTVAARIPTRLR